MPSFMWMAVLVLCIILIHTTAHEESNSKTKSASVNGVNKRSNKREAIVRNNPFLKDYPLSANMKSLLHLKTRRKRSAVKKRKIKKDDLVKLEKIIRSLAATMKRELVQRKSCRKEKRKNIKRRTFEDKRPETKLMSKKDLENMVKAIVQDSYNTATTESPPIEDAELRKRLDSIEDVKKSLASIMAITSEKPVFIKPSTTEHAETLFSLDFRHTTQDLLHVFTTPKLHDFVNLQKDSAPQKLYEYVEYKPVKRTDENANANASSNDHESIQKILQDVEVIKNQKDSGGKGGGGPAAFPCNPEGSWTSVMGGKVLQIAQGGHNVLIINTTDSVPNKEGFLNNPTWKLCGTNPFPSSGLILVTAINEPCRQVAAFIGECKFCEGKEIMQGQWLIGKLGKDCSDVIASQDVIGDVWKREVLHELRKKRLGLD